MDDLISRKAAIDSLGERPLVWSDNDDYTLGERNQYDMDRLAIETVPSAEPEISLLHAAKIVLEFIESCDGTTAWLITPDGDRLSCDWGYVEEGIRELILFAERRTDG